MAAPPGWYPDPRNPDRKVWWSGSEWVYDLPEPADVPAVEDQPPSVTQPDAPKRGCMQITFMILSGFLVLLLAVGFCSGPEPDSGSVDLEWSVLDSTVTPNGYYDVVVGISNPSATAVSEVNCTLYLVDERGDRITGLLESMFSGDVSISPGGDTTISFEMGKPDAIPFGVDGSCSGQP